MAVAKGKAACSTVVGRRNVGDQGIVLGGEKAGVINAVRMLVNKGPRVGWSRQGQLRHFDALRVKIQIVWALSQVPSAKIDVSRKAAAALGPTQSPLGSTQKLICRALKDGRGVG